ncbi:MAG: peptidoglycan bridge formation glycyltransferase FemA/FemB family protein, partial [candidate division WOR-3 bacterium]
KIHPKHRNSIRRAEKGGVNIFEDTSEDGIIKFQKMSEITYGRSNKQPLSLNYLLKYYNSLKNTKRIRIFFAEKDSVLQAGAVFLTSDYMSIYWHGASINSPFPGASNLLNWKVMNIFKNEGVKLYDFGGVSLELENKKAQSISFFKERFGGEIRYYYGGELVLNNIKNILYKFMKKVVKL